MLICPACHGNLESTTPESGLFCNKCSIVFPTIFGIQDMRAYVTDRQRDREKAGVERVMKLLGGTFEDVLEKYVRMTEKGNLVQHELNYELGYKERANNTFARLSGLEKDARIFVSFGTYLDIGCGKGSLIERGLRDNSLCYGLDYVPAYVALTKRLIDFLPIKGKAVHAVIGDAQSLPFVANQFDLVTMLDIVEHVQSPRQAMREVRRVLKSEGVLYANSPNRFNIFTLEDHVRIPWLGFVPRPWQKKVVRIIKRCGYDGVNLLSVGEFIELLETLSPGKTYIDGLRMDGHHSSKIKSFLQSRTSFLKAINRLFFRFLPSHHAIYMKGHG